VVGRGEVDAQYGEGILLQPISLIILNLLFRVDDMGRTRVVGSHVL